MDPTYSQLLRRRTVTAVVVPAALLLGAVTGWRMLVNAIYGHEFDHLQQIFSTLLYALLMLAAAYVGFRLGPPADRAQLLGVRPAALWRVLVWPSGLFFAFLGIQVAIALVLGPSGRAVPPAAGALGVAFGFAMVCCSPVTEELFFRGYLFGRGRLLGFWPAAGYSGLVFAAGHVTDLDPRTLQSVAIIFVGGILCAAARELSGSIIASVMLHTSVNAMAAIFVVGPWIAWGWWAITVALCLTCGVVVNRRSRRATLERAGERVARAGVG